MQVRLDGELIPVDRPTFSAALDAGRKAADLRGRVIVEVKVDGRQIADDDLASPSDETNSGSVEFISANASALVSHTLLELAPLLASAEDQQTRAADLIGAGKVQEGLEQLAGAFDIWNGVQRAVGDGLALLGTSPDEARVAILSGEQVRVSDAVHDLAKHLGEVKRTLQAQDLSGLCDVLLYDLKEQADRWAELLTALSDAARTGALGTGNAIQKNQPLTGDQRV